MGCKEQPVVNLIHHLEYPLFAHNFFYDISDNHRVLETNFEQTDMDNDFYSAL